MLFNTHFSWKYRLVRISDKLNCPLKDSLPGMKDCKHFFCFFVFVLLYFLSFAFPHFCFIHLSFLSLMGYIKKFEKTKTLQLQKVVEISNAVQMYLSLRVNLSLSNMCYSVSLSSKHWLSTFSGHTFQPHPYLVKTIIWGIQNQ